jgi:hypothetical protein
VTPGPATPEHATPGPTGGAGHRLEITLLGCAAAATLTALWACLGVAGAGAGAAVLAVAALLAARYIAGADAFDGDYRRSVRLVTAREPSLQGWAAAVDAARATPAGFERVLRPQLERLYAVRLAERHGVSLHTDPDRAAALVGPALFPWIDPRRPPPPEPPRRTVLDRRARAAAAPPPVPDTVLEALVRRLETL